MAEPTGEIRRAIEKYDARKEAASEHLDLKMISTDEMEMLLDGLGLSLEELHECRTMATHSALSALGLGNVSLERLAGLIASVWVDGFVTGLMMGEDRDGTE